MLDFHETLILFQNYYKMLLRHNKMLKEFDMEGCLKLSPHLTELSHDYQATLNMLIDLDSRTLAKKPQMKQKIHRLLRKIQDALTLQKKLLSYAKMTQESLMSIHQNYVERANITTYKANGHRPSRRHHRASLSELL